MAKILKFEKPKELSVEEKFIESLSQEQIVLFWDMFEKIQQDFENIEMKYAEKCAQCEALKIELKIYKGAKL